MKWTLVLVTFMLVAPRIWSDDSHRYDCELVRTYGIGQDLSQFQTNFRWDWPQGPTAVAFDRVGNLYVCDAVRERVAAGDRSLDVREEHVGTFSGNVLGFEVDERGIVNQHYFEELSFVDRTFTNRFIVSYEEGRLNNRTRKFSSLYYGDVLFTYLRDGSLVSVVRPGLDWRENEGKTLSHGETRALFNDPRKYGLDGLTLDESGRLFVNGDIATRSYRVFLGWCEERSGGKVVKTGRATALTIDPRLAAERATYQGVDLNANTYWLAGDTILVFTRSGAVLDVFMSKGRLGIGTVHPSGDTYGLSFDANGVYLHRIRNIWDPKAREIWEAYVISTTGEGIRTGEVTAGPLRVRRAAGPMGEIAGELQKGERVEVLWHGSEKAQIDGKNDYWYEVRRKSDGLQGWIYGGYLRIE